MKNPVDFYILFTDLAFKLYCVIDYDGLTALRQHYLLPDHIVFPTFAVQTKIECAHQWFVRTMYV